ncbi:MAG: TonB-dependent receptor [Bacteroidetes bacterium]|nr:TonB-dependent receptor [Bacteroidota bacterium]
MRKTVLALGLIFCSYLLFAQQTITGKVIDRKTGSPISGASVRVKSTKKGTSTDNQGLFKINANAGDVLEITSIGYSNESVSINGSSDITVNLSATITDLGEIVVVGSRGAPRVKTDSPVPIDVIKVNQVGEVTARMDLSSILNVAAPSFNYNKQSGADGADAIDLGTLRGLGPDQTLVLINGKRRHQTAFVALFGTRGRGNSGTDLNAIPESMIDHVEILRDGASAQYGSDAIAGVINIVLKKDINHLTINTGWSGYYDHKYNSLNSFDKTQFETGSQIDGNALTLGINYGLPIGKNGGFINFGGNFLSQGKTFREVPDTNVATNPKAIPFYAVRRAFGDASVAEGGAMFNTEIPIAGTKATFYSFGGYNYKNSNAYAFSRNYPDHPEKFPTDGAGNIVYVPGLMHTTSDGSVFFDPIEDVHITDMSLAAGIRGSTHSNWDWDISNTVGYNNFHYYGDRTFNASFPVGQQTAQTHFDDGGFSFLQNTINADISKRFSNVAQGLTLAFGAEYRYEQYKIYAGEEASWKNYGSYFVSGGDTTYKVSGAQGFPGFEPANVPGSSVPGDAVNANRSNVGAYVDAQIDITKAWLVDLAARVENYNDFGFLSTYKFATRYKVSDNFNLRASASTGFRAPSLQQINFSNTFTTAGVAGISYVKIAPNYGPIAKAAGIPNLKQEKSVNASLGFAWKPINGLTITTDGYLVKIKNRVVLSGEFDNTTPALAPILNSLNISDAEFFTNAVNTTNLGVDVVVDYTKKWNKQSFKILLTGNIQHMKIDKINVPTALNDTYFDQQKFYSTREQAFLLASAPKAKFSLSLDYTIKKFGIGTRLTYFGKLTTQGFGYSGAPGVAAGSGLPGDPDISGDAGGYNPYVATDDGSTTVPENFVFHPKVTTDLYLSYKFCKNFTLFAGVDNIFNVHPDQSVVPNAKYASADDSESGGPFDAVQMGYNGMRLFTKLAFNF